jgi:hypothetical protein
MVDLGQAVSTDGGKKAPKKAADGSVELEPGDDDPVALEPGAVPELDAGLPATIEGGPATTPADASATITDGSAAIADGSAVEAGPPSLPPSSCAPGMLAEREPNDSTDQALGATNAVCGSLAANGDSDTWKAPLAPQGSHIEYQARVARPGASASAARGPDGALYLVLRSTQAYAIEYQIEFNVVRNR